MKNTLLLFLLMLFPAGMQGIEVLEYQPLDPQNPVLFRGDHIIYKGERIELGPRAFFIDGRFPDEVMEKYSYVFNSVDKAVAELTDGQEGDPMVLYLAPYVYWIDDPDDPAIRTSRAGRPPFRLEIYCNWLTFYGLSDDPRNIVLVSNRGQTYGALGNFTMF
ncbi:MAG: hypothetical protein LUD15_15475 [Bacteroides sp.]|nr:hypothetical protein [Bacteroides sp.]